MSSERKRSLLVLDDDPGVVEFLCESLGERGFEVVGLTSPREALARLQADAFDLLITDVEMPEMRGTELLAAVLAIKPTQLVLLITAFGSIDLAVASVRAGACDFIAKPFTIDALVAAIARAFDDRQIRREIVRLRPTTAPAAVPGQLIAESPAMRKVLESARRAARADSTVLLTGETGTGKGAVARYIHEASARRGRPFFHVNCASLPSALVESELFGVRRGAFTDARDDRPGAFVGAADGTLFLDEIGELPLDIQAKLLHALENGRVRPLGGTTDVEVKARILAATNRPLETLLSEGRFRPDLYYRMNVIRIEVPSLRERRDDIPPLVDLFLGVASTRHGRPLLGVSAAAMRRLVAYQWPGNVRELANLLERAVALSDHDALLAEDVDLPADTSSGIEAFLTSKADHHVPLAEVERLYARQVVEAQGGNKAAAARLLGINRRTLYRMLDR
jgi:DNA-binding NtrC family response regulator